MTHLKIKKGRPGTIFLYRFFPFFFPCLARLLVTKHKKKGLKIGHLEATIKAYLFTVPFLVTTTEALPRQVEEESCNFRARPRRLFIMTDNKEETREKVKMAMMMVMMVIIMMI